MDDAKRETTWYGRAALVVCAVCLVCGCASSRAHIEKELMSHPPGVPGQEGVSERYLVGCPDVLEIKIPHRPELSGKHVIATDGRIDLGDYGRPRVEGRELGEIARLLAADMGTHPAEVEVRV